MLINISELVYLRLPKRSREHGRLYGGHNLVDWLGDVQIQSNLLHETLFLTIFTVERSLAVEGKDVHRYGLWLVGVAAMFLISKIDLRPTCYHYRYCIL